MIKQILGKLPRHKPPKSDDGTARVTSQGTPASAPAPSRNPNSGSTVIQGRFANGVKTTPYPFGDSPSSDLYLEPLPLFREVPNNEKQNLFIRKLALCSVVFDFTDGEKNLKEKDIKRQTLLELVDFVGTCNTKFSELAMEHVTAMVSANAFRTLPPPGYDTTVIESFDADEEEPSTEPSWVHLQVVYELFLRFIMSPETDAKLAKRYIDHTFILKLIDLFDSEDAREREYLKTILHRIYGKFMVHRPFIRKAINNVFYRFIFETERHNGISELLEILGSIINGFALPLKEEHKLFLVRALIPLHKPKCVSIYHRQLSYCITQFVEKDFKLADTVIRGLLKYWPVTNSHKEVLFLSEVEEVLEGTQPAEFQRCMVPLFRQIGRCLNSSHFQVAERALFLWNNDHVVNLVKQNRDVILPIIFSALETNAEKHWNPAVHSLSMTVRKLFIEMDQDLFQTCKRKYDEDKARSQDVEERRSAVWQRLEALASSRSMSKEAVLVHK